MSTGLEIRQQPDYDIDDSSLNRSNLFLNPPSEGESLPEEDKEKGTFTHRYSQSPDSEQVSAYDPAGMNSEESSYFDDAGTLPDWAKVENTAPSSDHELMMSEWIGRTGSGEQSPDSTQAEVPEPSSMIMTAFCTGGLFFTRRIFVA